MSELSIWATLTVLPGQQAAAEEFFAFSRSVLVDEPGTTSFFAVKLDEQTYGIFDTFTDQAALDEHIAGDSGKNAVIARVGTIFAGPPQIMKGSVLERA